MKTRLEEREQTQIIALLEHALEQAKQYSPSEAWGEEQPNAQILNKPLGATQGYRFELIRSYVELLALKLGIKIQGLP